MLSYQHGYHAGCFADVVKHLTLTIILDYLIQKDKPLFYLETHAGKGLYDLRDMQSQKTGEYRRGVSLIWEKRNELPEVFSGYMQVLADLNPDGFLRYYPGSPQLALKRLRLEDRLYFCELHPQEFEALETVPREEMRAHCSQSDGIVSLKSLLPPPEKRGFIFLDPAFECKEEYSKIPRAIQAALQRFGTGTYGLWYPMVDKYLTDKLNRHMQTIKAPTLHITFSLRDTSKGGMSGCGLWIINPPYILEKALMQAKPALEKYLQGTCQIAIQG